ncbi:MAG: site-specific integrase, partial [Syntrophaceae bacterium]
LAALKRAFSLAEKNTPPKVVRRPYIPMLKENNVRTGYFEYDEFIRLQKCLPEHLRPITTMAYYTGMRRGELLALKWSQVDLFEKKITLSAGSTKNDEARVVYMPDELFETLRSLRIIRDRDYPQCQHVFSRYGKPFGEFKKGWMAGCKKAGLDDRLFHDLRRTAIRNMSKAGIPERVAMKISGHKTRSVFDRYNIVNEEDLKQAAGRVSIYHESIRDEATQKADSRKTAAVVTLSTKKESAAAG